MPRPARDGEAEDAEGKAQEVVENFHLEYQPSRGFRFWAPPETFSLGYVLMSVCQFKLPLSRSHP